MSLGTHTDKEDPHDFYFCPSGIGEGSVIARYGSEGSQYQSLSVGIGTRALFAEHPDYILAVAYRKAVEMGLLK